MHLLVSASLAAPTFGHDEGARHAIPPAAAGLGVGRSGTRLVSGFATHLGRPWYAGLRTGPFDGERDIWNCATPASTPESRRGAGPGDAGRTARRDRPAAPGPWPFVVVGHSIGSSATHAVTARLAADGAPGRTRAGGLVTTSPPMGT